MARDITTTPPIFPPRLNSDLLLRDIQFDRRHVGPPLPWPQRRKIIARSAAMARMLPSCAQLPSIWNRDMDRFVCECDALGEFNVKLVIRLLKKKWPYELGSIVVTPEAVERRVYCMDQALNDYFRRGMLSAVNRLEQKGIFLPPPDFGWDSSSSKGSMEVSLLHPAFHWGRGSTDFAAGEGPTARGGLRLVEDVEEEKNLDAMEDMVNVLTDRAYVPSLQRSTAICNENDSTHRVDEVGTNPISTPSGLLSRRDAKLAAQGVNAHGAVLDVIYDDNGKAPAERSDFTRSDSNPSRLIDRVQPITTEPRRLIVSNNSVSSRKETQMV